MTPISEPNRRVPMDQMGKRILRHLSSHVIVDVGAVAKQVGATEEVVQDRLAAMRAGGLLQGFEVRLDATRLERQYEFLVSGAPTPGTDGQSIARLCASGDVTRVFSLASAHNVAFTIVGKDAAATQRRGMALAEQAGLRQAQAVLVINTFQDRAATALADSLGVGPHARPADRDDPLNLVLPLVPTPYERRPLHLLVLLDRSGSMAQLSPATPDSPAQVKFDVAAQAVVALQEHLTPRDRLTVITFADRPEKLFDAGPGTTDFAQLREALRRVRPSGSTRLGPALDLALGQDRTGQQPMLLVLSDAQTEDFQPAAYADRFRQGPVELAAVVIGDADGNQPPPPLETLAKLLSATYVRQEGMAGLARVFGRLVRQGRGDILRPGPFELQPAGPLFDLPPRPLPAAQAIYQAQALGQAQVLVRTAGGEPVVARERIALGRSVSLALPAGGPNQAWAAAPASAKLVAAALRWARREPNDPRLAVELARPDGRLAVRVRAEDQGKPVDGLHLRARIDRPEAPRPGGATQPADAGAAFELPQVAPGRYEAATPWPADEPAPVVVELDDRQAWSGASPALYAPEFARIGPDYDALRRLAEATGGRIVAADEAARALRQSRARAMTPLWPLAAGLALALMLTEWCLTRVRRA